MKLTKNDARTLSTREMCLTAMMSAVVFFATIVPRVPIPFGYAHLGDAAILLVVLCAGRRAGILAGAVGASMADVFGGFPIWAVPTFFLKALMAEAFYRAAFTDGRPPVLSSPRTAAALVLAMLVMAAGYALSGALLYGSLAAGFSMFPALLVKGAVNIAVVYLAGALLPKRR